MAVQVCPSSVLFYRLLAGTPKCDFGQASAKICVSWPERGRTAASAVGTDRPGSA